jgi:hypothetical protein
MSVEQNYDLSVPKSHPGGALTSVLDPVLGPNGAPHAVGCSAPR